MRERLGQIDSLGVGLDRIVIAFAYLLQNIAHLVDPAALMPGPRIDGGDRRRQSGTTVGDDQLQVLAFQPAPVQVLQQPLPIALTLAAGLQKGQQLASSVAPHSVSHQHLHSLSPAGPSHPQAHPIQEQIRPVVVQWRLMKLAHRLVQIARQLRNGLRAHHLASQRSANMVQP